MTHNCGQLGEPMQPLELATDTRKIKLFMNAIFRDFSSEKCAFIEGGWIS